MVHAIYFFKEHTVTADGCYANGFKTDLYKYEGEMVCSFYEEEATLIMSWMMRNIEHGTNTTSSYGNPKINICVFDLMRMLKEIDLCINDDFYSGQINYVNFLNFFPNLIRTSDETYVDPKNYITILQRYKKVFEPLVWIDGTKTDYYSGEEWYYQIVSNYV